MDYDNVDPGQITYDNQGRMDYNLAFHKNTNTSWNSEDSQYLIDWYSIVGPEEMSFALERTVKSIESMVLRLRNKGVMKKPNKRVSHSRINKMGRGY